MGLTRVILVRHGETDWSRGDNRYCGVTDVDLNETGKKQARLLAGALKGTQISAIYSSALRRTMDTAQAIAEACGLEVRLVPGLNEMDFGEWEGLNVKEISKVYGEYFERWRKEPEHLGIPGGESYGIFRDRVIVAFWEIVGNHLGETVVIVGHKSTNRVILCVLLGIKLSNYKRIGQVNGAINVVEIDDNKINVVKINDICHLRVSSGTGELDW